MCVAVMLSQGFLWSLLIVWSDWAPGWGGLETDTLNACLVPALSHHCLHFTDEDAHRGYVACQGPTGQKPGHHWHSDPGSLTLEQGFLTAALLTFWAG